MGSEKYKLKWSKYESNILSAFHSLLESDTLSDVTLFCEGQTFKAHRLVLAACSTHFENLFNHTPVNAPLNNQFFVILDGTRADDLQILLHFMYRGEAFLHQDRINSVLRTAEVLQVKGLSEGPRNIEINQNLHHGSGTASSRSWSPSLSNPEASPRHKKSRLDLDRERGAASPILGRRPLSPGAGNNGGGGGVSPSYSYPPSTSREPFPIFPNKAGGAVGAAVAAGNIVNYMRGGSGGAGVGPVPLGAGGNNGGSPYSPPLHHRSKSPPPAPPLHTARYLGSKFSPSANGPDTKDDREATATSNSVDMYEVRSSSRLDADIRPASVKTDRMTPNEYERGTPHSAPSPHSALHSVGSVGGNGIGSTTASLEGPSGLIQRATPGSTSSSFKEEPGRLRRASEAGSEADPAGTTPTNITESKFQDFRSSVEDPARITNSSPNADLRLREEEVRNQAVAANNLETFRRLAQAHADAREREQLLPRGVLQRGGLPTVTLAPGLTASDYMRFAMPVRDPDNGDAISGSGTKLRCPFCERTYGYETNLRAHIRQRHQGIRVSCPYCPRTFTRNNTVRRHVQREHRHLAGRIPTKFGSTRVLPDPITNTAAVAHHNRMAAAAAVQVQGGTGSPPPQPSGSVVGGPPEGLGGPKPHP